MQDVAYERREEIAVITLDRPDARNALTTGMFEGLAEAMSLAESDGARAIVLTGAGDYFCAGLDLKALLAADGSEEEVLGQVLDAGIAAVAAFGISPLASVSAVAAGAVGGGLGLALATDLCVAGASARLSTQYAKVGTTPDVGVSWHLAQRLGPARAAKLLLLSPTLEAGEAAHSGLIDAVSDDGAELETALALAAELAQRPPHVVQGMRSLTASAPSNTLEEHLAAERALVHRSWKDPNAQAYAAAFRERTANPEGWEGSSGLT